jgi:hypothetical protein
MFLMNEFTNGGLMRGGPGACGRPPAAAHNLCESYDGKCGGSKQ